MRNPPNPKWLFVLNTLPVAVLLLLLGGVFGVIEPLLPPESLRMWQGLWAALLALAALAAAYAAGCLWRREPLHWLYGAVLVLLSTGLMFLYFSHMADVLFPRIVPRWMLGSETELYAFPFLMPAAVPIDDGAALLLAAGAAAAAAAEGRSAGFNALLKRT